MQKTRRKYYRNPLQWGDAWLTPKKRCRFTDTFHNELLMRIIKLSFKYPRSYKLTIWLTCFEEQKLKHGTVSRISNLHQNMLGNYNQNKRFRLYKLLARYK